MSTPFRTNTRTRGNQRRARALATTSNRYHDSSSEPRHFDRVKLVGNESAQFIGMFISGFGIFPSAARFLFGSHFVLARTHTHTRVLGMRMYSVDFNCFTLWRPESIRIIAVYPKWCRQFSLWPCSRGLMDR